MSERTVINKVDCKCLLINQAILLKHQGERIVTIANIGKILSNLLAVREVLALPP